MSISASAGSWPGPRPGALVRAGVAVASAAVVVAMAAMALPRVTSADWAGVVEQITRLSPSQLVLPSLVWVASLWAWAVASAAALPGFTVSQALTMNLAGSAVSNVAPLGATLGVGASYAMARSWGVGAAPFALFTLLTGVANLLVRLVLPVAALLLLGPLAGDQLQAAATGTALLLAATLGVAAVAIGSERGAERAGSAAGAAVGCMLRLVGSRRRPRWDQTLVRSRGSAVQLLAQRWPTLTLATIATTALHLVLMWQCLRAVGADQGMHQGMVPVVAVLALERVLSSVPLTPSGVGITETGCVALLVALGAPAEAAVAGILLFRGFTYLAEIPAGALAAGVWAARRSWRAPRAHVAAGAVPAR